VIDERTQRAYEAAVKRSMDYVAKGLMTKELTIPEGFEMPAKLWVDPIKEAQQGHSYVIYGPSGVGKSTAIKYIAIALCKNCWKIGGGSVPYILDRLKSDGSDEYRESILHADALILDDLDKMLGTKYELEQLFFIIENFTRKEKPILVSMNISPGELGEKLGESKHDLADAWIDGFADRLTDRATVIHKTGATFRKSKNTVEA
jgi:DNA replication protein DnaC